MTHWSCFCALFAFRQESESVSSVRHQCNNQQWCCCHKLHHRLGVSHCLPWPPYILCSEPLATACLEHPSAAGQWSCLKAQRNVKPGPYFFPGWSTVCSDGKASFFLWPGLSCLTHCTPQSHSIQLVGKRPVSFIRGILSEDTRCWGDVLVSNVLASQTVDPEWNISATFASFEIKKKMDTHHWFLQNESD